jgi:2-methylfumaryl-CoA isomerase
MVGNLGRIAQAQLGGFDQSRDGNYLYGAFGHDFPTADGRRVMVVALTARQWDALLAATDTAAAMASLEPVADVDLSTEAGRYAARDLIAAVLRPWFARHTLAEIRDRFTRGGVSWGPYQTFQQLVDEDPRASTSNPLFEDVEHPTGGRYRTPRSPLEFSRWERRPAGRAPRLGHDTEAVLGDVLGLSDRELGRLLADGVVAGTTGG